MVDLIGDDILKFTVYELRNKLTGTKYFGMTSRTIHARMKSHIAESNYMNTKGNIQNAIKLFGKESFEIVKLNVFNDKGSAHDAEKLLIKNGFQNGEKLYNLTQGGAGNFGLPEKWKPVDAKKEFESFVDRCS